jgi:hypothetical protein
MDASDTLDVATDVATPLIRIRDWDVDRAAYPDAIAALVTWALRVKGAAVRTAAGAVDAGPD